LGIRATHDLAKRGEKGRCGEEENMPAKTAEMRSESRGFKEELINEAFWIWEMVEKVMIQIDKCG
jgi:hypothetical protein